MNAFLCKSSALAYYFFISASSLLAYVAALVASSFKSFKCEASTSNCALFLERSSWAELDFSCKSLILVSLFSLEILTLSSISSSSSWVSGSLISIFGTIGLIAALNFLPGIGLPELCDFLSGYCLVS